jgi:putative Mg2+ transporter-C (MgtC) family protein
MDEISVSSGFADIALRLGVATLLGAAAGLNRELRQKPAGLRTHALVSLGASLAALIGLMLSDMATTDEAGAASRVIQGVFAGIGFIGGGVILHRQEAGAVEGLTTAALIWVVAAAGVAAGLGLWRSAAAAVALALVVLVGGDMIERRLNAK